MHVAQLWPSQSLHATGTQQQAMLHFWYRVASEILVLAGLFIASFSICSFCCRACFWGRGSPDSGCAPQGTAALR